MTKLPGRKLLVGALVVVSTQAQAAGSSYFIEARNPRSDIYLFAGPAWQGSQEGLPDFTFIPVEARWISVEEYEVDIRSAAMRTSDDGNWEIADSTISLVKGWRDVGSLRYLSVEATQVISESSSDFQSDLERFARVRGQWGYTRATLDWSVAIEQHDSLSNDVDDAAMTTSLGIRSQQGAWNLGADVFTTVRGGLKPAISIDFVTMRRFMNGHAVYGIVQNGVAGPAEGWYVGIGYEVSFGAF